MKENTNIATSPLNTILVTGGYGFIGSNFIRYLFEKTDFSGRIINVDKLTYAANPQNLSDINEKFGDRYFFEQHDICDTGAMKMIFETYDVDTIVHFAAESHVDRSIHDPDAFLKTNIEGTHSLLKAAKKIWLDDGMKLHRFHHVSTDEVYGSLGPNDPPFNEENPYRPNSPYSASKAASDHLVRAYNQTYGLQTTISNCSNNYGPYQFPEKLIPLMMLSALEGKPLPIYGDGLNIRDWLYVEDHCYGIWLILQKGRVGETYNIGGNNEKTNVEIVTKICELLDEIIPINNNQRIKNYKIRSYKDFMNFVKDRPGHDRRYAIDAIKVKKELGYSPKKSFQTYLKATVKWYLKNETWWRNIMNGSYREWIERQYGR